MTADTETNAIGVETAKEVVRLSELYIDGTVRLSLAADTRALQISNMLAAASTLLLGFGLANVLDQSNPARLALAAASLSCGATFLAALLFSASTIRPREFNIGGTLRSQWSDAELRGNLAVALMSQADNYEGQALENIATLSQNAQHIRRALTIMVWAIPLSAAIGATTYGVLILCT
jgi:hypothetical protein